MDGLGAVSESDSFVLSCDCHESSWPTFLPSDDRISERIAKVAVIAASYLTDPVCKGHELFRRVYLVDALHPQASKTANLGRKFFFFVAIAGCATVALVTTIPGILLRYIATQFQKNPYMSQTHGESKTLPDNRTFSLLSWNICCTSGGYSISDGGVLPWSFRINEVLDQIVASDADVNCLYEIFDIQTALLIAERLKQEGYTHFYFNMGSKPIGMSSGLFVASKYEISNAEFTLFPEETLVGRTKFAAKGVFGFDLVSEGKSFARIFATHLQHSEEPGFATAEEVEGRRLQMLLVMDKINTVRDRCIILTGDLNLDDDERQQTFWNGSFDQGILDYQGEKTWGGDGFCAEMTDKRPSAELNLDYTLVLKDTAQELRSSLIPTGFDGAIFQPDALSDHAGVLSVITV